MKKIIIAIDGPSASGKSTVAKILAKKLGYKYIDTGAMYRAISLYALRHSLDVEGLLKIIDRISIGFDDKNNILLNGEDVSKDIRTSQLSDITPIYAADARIREHLVVMQQKLGHEKGIVMDGRDIASVVFPDAELKIYQVASARARAQRRCDEYNAKGITCNLEDITKEIEQRDLIDSTRDASPMVKTEDAIELDTSNMSVDQVVESILNLVEEKVK